MKAQTNLNYITWAAVAVIITALAVPLLLATRASAAPLTQTLVRFDRMKISQATTGTVCAMTGSAGSETTVTVTFPAGYTVSGTTGNWTTSTANLAWPSGAVAWPSIGASASAASGQDVTWASGDLSTSTLYCFNWTNTAALSISGAASASNAGAIATDVDSATDYTTASIADDQIIVTATVPQTFSFALSANTDPLGTLSTSSVESSPTPRTATVNTNAKNGWQVWARDATTGLNSASAAYTIPSTTPGANSTLSSGTEGYNTGVTSAQASGTGTITVAVPFVGAVAGQGGGLDTSLRSLASSNGTANNAVLTLTNNAAISSITPAGSDYTDTITVVGAGLF